MRNWIVLFLIAVFANKITAQQIYIPYREGNLWGLADTMGKIVFPPQYDRIQLSSDFWWLDKELFFITEKKGLKGVIRGSKVIIPPVYTKLQRAIHYYSGEDGKGDSKKISLYNKTGKLLNPQPYKSVKSFYHEYDNQRQTLMVAEQTANNYSLLYIDSTGNMVALLKNQYSIDKFGDLLLVKKNASATDEFYKFIRPAKGPLQLSKQPPPVIQDSGESSMDMTAMPVEVPSALDNKTYNFFKNNGVWKAYANYKEVTVDFNMAQYDTVYMPSNFYTGIYRYGIGGNMTEYRQILITRKNGMYGVLYPDGKTIPNLFESLQHFQINTGNYSLKHPFKGSFMVKQGGGYGIIDIDGNVAIPAAYDTITPALIVKQNNRWGAVQTDGSWILPAMYDEVIFENFRNQYTMKKDGKYGAAFFTQDPGQSFYSIACISPYPFTGYTKFQAAVPKSKPYIVFEVIENNKLLGYFDRKGFAYFK